MTERRSWTEEEDVALKYLKNNLQVKKWSQIARRMEFQFNLPGRNGKQCRERYTNHLDSSIIYREFSLQEEEKLFQLHDKIGNKWSLICKQFNGRTDNQIKNHFHSKLRKAMRKFNKDVKQQFKKILKPFRLNIIYKVVEASDYRFSDKFSLNKEVLGSFNQLKNFLLQYAGGIVDKTQLSSMKGQDQVLFLASKLQNFEKFLKDKKFFSNLDSKQKSQSTTSNTRKNKNNESTSDSEVSCKAKNKFNASDNEMDSDQYDEESFQYLPSSKIRLPQSKLVKQESVESHQANMQQSQNKQDLEMPLIANSFYSFSFDRQQIDYRKINSQDRKSEFLTITQSLIQQKQLPEIPMTKKLSICSLESLKEFNSLRDSEISDMLGRYDNCPDIEEGLFE